MSLTERVETLTTENLKACAIALFANHEDGAGEALAAVLTELEFRMGDEFAAWSDETF